MNLGENIKFLRTQNGLTQDKMSEILNKKFPDTVNFNKGTCYPLIRQRYRCI